jgi:hypothetical protein
MSRLENWLDHVAGYHPTLFSLGIVIVLGLSAGVGCGLVLWLLGGDTP